MELWREIPGLEGRYEASSHGRVRSVDRIIVCSSGVVKRQKSRVLKSEINGAGYRGMRLGRGNPCMVHQVVALAFLGPAPAGFYVCHNDGDKMNNLPSNLRYDTPKGNQNDRAHHGTQVLGSALPQAILNEFQAAEIKRLIGSAPYHVIGKRFGVTGAAVGTIARGICWKHVTI